MLFISKVVVIVFETFYTNESLVGRVIEILVWGSKGIVWVNLILRVWLVSEGVSIKLADESTGSKAEQQDTFTPFSMVVPDAFLI
jgi:hypothetical protein